MSDVILYRTPASAWLKASAAAVRGYWAVRSERVIYNAIDIFHKPSRY